LPQLLRMKTIHCFVLLACLMTWGTAHASSDSLFIVHGQVVDAITKQPLANVNISLKGTYIGTTTDFLGKYTLGIPTVLMNSPTIAVEFSHLGYASKKMPLNTIKSKKLNMSLDPQGYEIKEVTISGGPTMVFGNINYQLYDYEIKNGLLIMIGYEKRLGKATLLVVDADQKILFTHRIPSRPIKLTKDCRDDVFVVTQDYFLQVKLDSHEVRMPQVEQDALNRIVNSCVDRFEEHYYFVYNTFARYGRRYYDLDTVGLTSVLIEEIKDERTVEMAQDDESFLIAWSMANTNENNANRIKKNLDSDQLFNQTIMFRPLNAPLRVINDTVLIFNHLDGQIQAMDAYGSPRYIVPIDYHLKKKWGEEIIKDPVQQKIYTYHLDNGHTEISQIDPVTGKAKMVLRTDFRYIEKLQVYDGAVYFLYRPFGSVQRKALYRERL